MAIHDAYGRITPFELILPTGEFADERFPGIEEEAEERGADPGNPEAFPLLGEAGAILRELRPEDADPQLMTLYGNLLFHAYHFWKEGLPLYLTDTGVVRFLVETGPGEGAWKPSLPGRAGYVQLPQHLIWTVGAEEDAPESLDGFFWSAPEGGDLSITVVLGIRRDRPGLSAVPLPPLPLESAAPWASVSVRPDGQDFATDLPGAELERLYGIEAGAEVLKLAMRVFWYLDTFPGSVAGAEGARKPNGDGDETGPVATHLECRRIILGDA